MKGLADARSSLIKEVFRVLDENPNLQLGL